MYRNMYIVVISKWYTGINKYQNITFFWSNQNSLRYEIDSLDCNKFIGIVKKI